MPDGHDCVFFPDAGVDFKAIGETVRRNAKGMVAHGLERVSDVFQDAGSVMFDIAWAAVDDPGRADDSRPIGVCDALVSEADAEKGSGGAEFHYYFLADPEIFFIENRPRARGNDDMGRGKGSGFFDGQTVVFKDHGVATQFGDALVKVEGERIIIIYDQCFHS